MDAAVYIERIKKEVADSSVLVAPIPGFDGYFADTEGRIWSARPHGGMGGPSWPEQARLLKPYWDGRCYKVMLSPAFKEKHRPVHVHVAVLLAFRGSRPDGAHARHLNDNQADNRLVNLAWGSPAENGRDAVRNGRTRRGESHGACRLSDADVQDIRGRRSQGETLASIAADYGVSFQHVGAICQGAKRCQ